ncbi:MAG: hypothetical protein FWD71_12725 [Oscillospiraceae bacterium]|nr:hypothetical protein [Oscillospiraceae bacterium]
MNIKKLPAFLYNGGYVVVLTLVYVLIGALFGMWHPTWLLFLTIPCYYMLAEFRSNRDWNLFPYPIVCLILYLAAGFDYGWWHPGWIIFLTVPIYYIAVNTVQHN